MKSLRCLSNILSAYIQHRFLMEIFKSFLCFRKVNQINPSNKVNRNRCRIKSHSTGVEIILAMVGGGGVC